MVFYGGVCRYGVEIVLGQECVDFVVEVVYVYDCRRLSFVGSGNHGVIAGDFLVDLF